MDLKAGESVGAYEIVSMIGAGGMGEVYRARDHRLGRDVALKFLPAEVAADTDRRARFDREARSLAALDHAGIVAIYAIESTAAHSFIVMEYVDGKSIAEIIPAGGFRLDRLLNISVQIAAAVAAAHRAGIVHRDLKPSNVMVRSQDRIKVLDFGLAKLSAQAGGEAETLPGGDITGEGRIVGTVAYMSPEQAEGRAVDERSDIFSLGVLIYEMACGERPFKGDTSLSVMSAILRDTPKPLSELNPALPRELARIVRRCLAKDADERYQSAADLRSDLEDVRQSSISGQPAPVAMAASPRGSRRWSEAAIAIGALLLGAIGALAWARSQERIAPIPAMQFTRLTMLGGVTVDPAISPDGKWVAYANTISGNGDIYLQGTTGQNAINLTKDSQLTERMPAFSPDGELIAFRSDRDGGGLFVMGRTGDRVRRLTKMGYTPSWFPDGRTIVYSSLQATNPDTRGGNISELWTVDINGGEPKRLFAGDAVQPAVSPNGKRIAFWGLPMDPESKVVKSPNRDVWTVAADGSNPVRVTTDPATDWNPVWAPDGKALYFLSGRGGTMNLWRIGIDQTTGATNGQPVALTTPSGYIRSFTLSADGQIASYADQSATNNLARMAFDPVTATTAGAIEPITTGPRDFLAFDINPKDGQIVLMTNFGTPEDLLLVSSSDGRLQQLTADRFRDRNPRWTADGRQMLFYSDRSDNYELFSIDRDGGGLRQLTSTGGTRFYPVPSPDGSRVVASAINSYELFVYDAKDFSKPFEALGAMPAEMRGGSFIPIAWSPDGRSIAGYSGGNLWIYSLDLKSYRIITNGVGSFTAQWFPDGKRMLINRQNRLVIVDLDTGNLRPVLSLPGETIGMARLSPDLHYLYFIHGTVSGDVWTVRFGNQTTNATESR